MTFPQIQHDSSNGRVSFAHGELASSLLPAGEARSGTRPKRETGNIGKLSSTGKGPVFGSSSEERTAFS